MIKFAITIFALVTGVHAWANGVQSDSQASDLTFVHCQKSLIRINNAVVNFLGSFGATMEEPNFSLGVCRQTGSQSQLKVTGEMDTLAFKFQGEPLHLRLRLRNHVVVGSDSTTAFSWKKKPIYNQVGNIVGYDYSFHPDFSNTQFDFYEVQNLSTGIWLQGRVPITHFIYPN